MTGELAALATLLRPIIDRSQPEWKKAQQGLRHRLTQEVPRALAEHHGYVVRWCQELHTPAFGPLSPDAPSIELTFQRVPRWLGVGGKELDELDVLIEPSHVAVLGDPGAGKTTTLRRLARTVALEPSARPDDDWQFVVVIVCREETWDQVGLYDVLGRAVGITGRLSDDLDNPHSRIRDVLDAGCLLLIDGLDEVPARHRAGLERDITQLGRHLQNSKVIVSCRSGDYAQPLPGFETAEIRPLGQDQIKRFVDNLLGEGEAGAFYNALIDHPAAELANRPLFLAYLAAIYKRRATIPDRPTDVFEAIVRLVIQEWDEQRGVRRSSKWSSFGVDDKRRFLADLAYELTRADAFQFGEPLLVEVYEDLADRYELPKAQARMVAQELESHTGLLTQVGTEFEFSHLALQEYLAADALVRAPASRRTTWWESLPAVAAVTVAMSSDSNRWLHDLTASIPTVLEDIRPVRVFLDRLGQERPRFTRSEDLGHTLLRLVTRGHIEDPGTVARLGKIPAVRDSVADAIATYTNINVGAAKTRLSRYAPKASVPSEALAIETPVMVALVGEERLRQIEREMTKEHQTPSGRS